MTKLNFQFPEIKANVIPSLENSISSLERACNTARRMDVPSEFSYAGMLRNLDNTLNDSKKELVKIKEWLIQSNVAYENMNNELLQQNNHIQSINVIKRESIVRKIA